MFAWPTVLLLRLAATLRNEFHIELQAHARVLADFRRQLDASSSVALHGKWLALHGAQRWALVEGNEPTAQTDDVLLLRLDPHLKVLAAAFPMQAGDGHQLELFPCSNASRPGGVAGDGGLRRER
jgi:hypothetical protein